MKNKLILSTLILVSLIFAFFKYEQYRKQETKNTFKKIEADIEKANKLIKKLDKLIDEY